jgi:hypothetical protein
MRSLIKIEVVCGQAVISYRGTFFNKIGCANNNRDRTKTSLACIAAAGPRQIVQRTAMGWAWRRQS